MQLLGYLYVLLRLGPFMSGMTEITTSISSPTPGPSEELGVRLGGTTTHYIAHRFKSGHISPYTPFVGGISLSSPGLNTGVHSHRGGCGYAC